MTRDDFSKMKKVSDSKKLENSMCKGEAVVVDVFHDPTTKKYFQVQIKAQGDAYRETEPYENDWDVRDFNCWKHLS